MSNSPTVPTEETGTSSVFYSRGAEGAPQADEDAISEFLTSLYGAEPDGLIWIGGRADGFKGRTFSTVEDATDYALTLDAKEARLPAPSKGDEGRGIYHRGTTLAGTPDKGRGKAVDSAVVRFLALDVDVNGPGHKGTDYPDALAVVRELITEAGLPEPTSWVSSGGGFYPQWRLIESIDVRDPDTLKRVEADFVRFEKHCQAVWARHGFRLDSVRDLARIWRIPGTVNRKVAGSHVLAEVMEDEGSGDLFEYDALMAFLPEAVAPISAPPAPAARVTEPDAFEGSTNPEAVGNPDGTWTKDDARKELDGLLNKIRNTREGDGFNNTLNACTLRIMRFAPEFWTAEDACGWIEDAVRAAFDGDLSQADTDTIRSAMSAVEAQARPELFRFTRSEGDKGGKVKKVKKRFGSLKAEQFTEAAFTELVAEEVMRGRMVYTTALGWMKWTGKVWERCEEESVVNSLRVWILKRYADSAKNNREDESRWLSVQSRAKMTNIVKLCQGVPGVLLDAADFDSHHDLLSTKTCVVNLRTGETMPHDPKLLMTKMTSVGYEPGAHHEAFKKALTAIPDDVLDYLQLRLGQATTGYTADDHKMIMLTGGGGNGKTLLMDTVYGALGGYAEKIDNRILLLSKAQGSATPEKMSLRGARLAYIEETPEDTYLNANALKEVVGTPSMKGRHLYKEEVTWKATHTLFLNTNYPPRVSETDRGTWRRLMRIDFPYTFRTTNEAKKLRADGSWGELDREGDATIEARLRTNEARAAALAWLIEGARKWFNVGSLSQVETPASVEESTDEWRKSNDRVYDFISTYLRIEPGGASWVPMQHLYAEYREFVIAKGEKPESERNFTVRIEASSELSKKVKIQRKRREDPGMSTLPKMPESSPWASDKEGGKARELPQRMNALVGVAWLEASPF